LTALTRETKPNTHTAPIRGRINSPRIRVVAVSAAKRRCRMRSTDPIVNWKLSDSVAFLFTNGDDDPFPCRTPSGHEKMSKPNQLQPKKKNNTAGT
jgi:hypothetical protein